MKRTGKQRTLYLNGVEVGAMEITGDLETDLAAARKFLADKGIGRTQQRLTQRAKFVRQQRGLP